MSVRGELRQRIRIAVESATLSSGDEDQVTRILDAVMGLFVEVSTRVDEHDVTTMGDTHERVMWTRMIDASMVTESGSYIGRPVDYR